MKRNRLVTVLLVVLSILACASYVSAEVLVNDTFNSDSAGSNLSTLGWTTSFGAFSVSSDVIDEGQSAINSDGGWSQVKKDFSTRTLVDGETAAVSYTHLDVYKRQVIYIQI